MAKTGRPTKYTGIDLAKVEKLAGYGLIEEEIANFLGISPASLSNYKVKYPEFLETLKRGKLKADSKVVESLYKRATGYLEDDIFWSSYQGAVTATPYKKVIIPDVVAQIFWLKNRRSSQWRNSPEMTLDESVAEIAKGFASLVSASGTGRVASGDKQVP